MGSDADFVFVGSPSCAVWLSSDIFEPSFAGWLSFHIFEPSFVFEFWHRTFERRPRGLSVYLPGSSVVLWLIARSMEIVVHVQDWFMRSSATSW